jgi:hypothetical protein
MISCPICLHIVPDDTDICPFCSTDLTAEQPERIEEENWTIIRTVGTVFEAELIAGRLRSFGIPAVVLSQVDSTRNFTVGALAVAKVFVPDRSFDEAEEIMRSDDFRDGEDIEAG